jgi:hypothetical protein
MKKINQKHLLKGIGRRSYLTGPQSNAYAPKLQTLHFLTKTEKKKKGLVFHFLTALSVGPPVENRSLV